jgi:O-antigen/teichoic acid export membrane protein
MLQSLEKFAVIALLIILIFSRILNLNSVLIVLCLTALVFSVIKYFKFKHKIPAQTESSPEIKKEILKSIAAYSTPFLFWGLAGWLQLNSEKWIIAKILSASDVGIYSVMVSLVSILIGIPNTLLNEFSLPIIFQQFTDLKDKEKTEKGFNYIKILSWLVAAITVVSTLITLFFGRYLLLLISYREYTIYYYLLPLLTFGTGLFLTAQTMINLGLALNIPRIYLIPKIMIGIFSVVLNIILINSLGVSGAAYSVLTVGVIFFIYISMINKKLVNGFIK